MGDLKGLDSLNYYRKWPLVTWFHVINCIPHSVCSYKRCIFYVTIFHFIIRYLSTVWKKNYNFIAKILLRRFEFSCVFNIHSVFNKQNYACYFVQPTKHMCRNFSFVLILSMKTWKSQKWPRSQSYVINLNFFIADAIMYRNSNFVIVLSTKTWKNFLKSSIL